MKLRVDIEKKIGSFHLQSQFEAEEEAMAILGASGCGKSMTLKCIAGIEKPDRGVITLDGRVLFDSVAKINLPPQKRCTGYLFQNHMLFPNMMVEQNIACGIPRARRNRKELVAEKVSAFYLKGLEKHYPSQLSGGQQQRVALARILASEPDLLMLDEPFSALDSFLKWQLEQEILRVRDCFKGPILFVSHSRDEVYRLCERVVVMDKGHTQAAVGKEELFSDPQTLSATLLTGCKNISAAVRTGEYTLYAKDWHTELQSAKPVPDGLRYVGFRAHYFEIMTDKRFENTMELPVLRIIEDVFSMIVMLETGGEPLRFELDKAKWAQLEAPQRLCLRMPPDKLILMK